VSREGAPSKQPKAGDTPGPSGTPIWVWLIYGLGIVAGVIFALSVLFTLGAVVLSDDEETPVSYDVSWLAIVLWGAFVAVALATWFHRKRQRR
jgi:hypothetical protein